MSSELYDNVPQTAQPAQYDDSVQCWASILKPKASDVEVLPSSSIQTSFKPRVLKPSSVLYKRPIYNSNSTISLSVGCLSGTSSSTNLSLKTDETGIKNNDHSVSGLDPSKSLSNIQPDLIVRALHLTEDMNEQLIFDVEDSYFPSQPNDYLRYCQERLDLKRQKKLELRNLFIMQQSSKREEERALELKALAKSGGIGNGSVVMSRGRALNNLPAWMTNGPQNSK